MPGLASTPWAASDRARMAWRCRRGMKELDLLLAGWLERQFDGASDAQRGLFEALLELPDPQLARYLLRGERPGSGALATLVESIRAPGGIMSTPAPGGNLP